MLNHNRPKVTPARAEADGVDAKLTPKQSLTLELIAVRKRTGEELWTFGSSHKRTLEELEDLGLVHVMHGITEKTVRASITDTGWAAATSDTYRSPLEEERDALRTQVQVLKEAIKNA